MEFVEGKDGKDGKRLIRKGFGAVGPLPPVIPSAVS